MKTNTFLFIIIILSLLSTGCTDKNYDKKVESKYPKYSLSTNSYVPDSLHKEYANWVTETVRAASQNMTGGDYEDADETIEQAEFTAKRIYEKDYLVLRKDLDDSNYNYIYLLPKDMTPYELKIFDSLSTGN